MSQSHPKISKAKARLLLAHPFFATLLIRTQVVTSEDVPLAATDGDRIYLNPNFLDHLSVEDTMVVLAHEVGHDALLHSIRLGERNPEIANMAMDHAINLMLIDQGFKCPNAVPGGWLADPKYKGMNWERIYDDLRRNPPPPQPGGQGDGDPQSGGQPGQSKGGGAPQNGKDGKPGPAQPGKDWLHGDVLPQKHKDAAAQAAAEHRAKQRVASAANMARMAGKLKGELARMVDDMLEAKVHWTDVLREYMTQVVKVRDNWSKRNRRYRQTYLPSRGEKRMGPIIFIPDTSGSMWGDDMEKICSEMAHCAMQTQPESIRVLWADTKVAGEQVFAPDDFSFAALKPVGGGGTDMRVPLKHAEQYEPQVVVLMTDGYTPWPDRACPFPVICINTTNTPCPDWMQVIRI
jgi:predicted metal-dependent peptidase